VRSARGARQHMVRTLSTPARGMPGGAQPCPGRGGGNGAAFTPHALSVPTSRRLVCAPWRTHIEEVLLDGLPDGDVDAVPSKGAQVQAAGGRPDSLGPGCYGGLAQDGAKPGARRGGRGVKHIGRQARLGGLGSVVHINASLRVSAIASCRPAPADSCAQTHASQARRLGGSARVVSHVRGRHACWLGSEKELRLSGVGVA